MTLNGHFALKSVSDSATNEFAFLAFGPTVPKFAELPIYCQRQECSADSFYSKVRFMRIFAWVCWRAGGVKCKLGRRKWRFFRFFCSLYLPNLHMLGHNYYIVLCSPSVARHRHRSRWPRITLNGHFTLKSVSGCFSIWWVGVLAFG